MRTELPSDESANKRPAILVYRGLENKPYRVIYAEDLVAEKQKSLKAAPPGRETFSEKRVAEYLADWRDWKRQTSGRRVECQRHHLRQRLSHFSDEEIEDVITLARIGDAGEAVSFSEGNSEAKQYLEGLDVEDVIYDGYYGRFGNLILEGMRLVHEYEEARRIETPTQADDGGISEKAA